MRPRFQGQPQYRHLLPLGKQAARVAGDLGLGYPEEVGEVRAVPRAVVVVADGDRAGRDRVTRLLASQGIEVRAAHTGQGALDLVRKHHVDLVMVDDEIPGLGGVEACRVLKAISKGAYLPVILMSREEAASSQTLAFRTEADDYLAKPIDRAELLARVESMIRVKRTHDDVQFARTKMRYASFHEQLKSLPDHRHFHETLESSFGDAERRLRPLACAIVAVDGFRELAKAQGPNCATALLDDVSLRLADTIREHDVAARFRTAEFGVLMPDTRPADALAMADRIIDSLTSEPFEGRDGRLRLPVSIGVGLFPSANVRNHSELLDAASIAVARARVAGPNQVCVVQHQGYIFRPTATG